MKDGENVAQYIILAVAAAVQFITSRRCSNSSNIIHINFSNNETYRAILIGVNIHAKDYK